MLHLEGKNYFIESGDKGFANRQKSVFDQLDAVISENSISNTHQTGMEIDIQPEPIDIQPESTSRKRKRAETKHFKGQESIFKRPDLPSPIRRTQNIPDFRRNPHKWTKYSLSDVTEDVLSEKSNTAAAMSFLREIEARRNGEEEEKCEEKIVFKRPSKNIKSALATKVVEVPNDNFAEDGTTHFRGSKLVMPEYVVGKKPAKKGKVSQSGLKTKSENSSNQIQLNHLLDDEDDDNDIDS